jgi:hypothetical protein
MRELLTLMALGLVLALGSAAVVTFNTQPAMADGGCSGNC